MLDRIRPFYLAILLTVLVGKFVASHVIGMAEAVVYSILAVMILSYWAFCAWLKAHQTKAPDDDKELKADVAELKSKMNAVILKEGLRM